MIPATRQWLRRHRNKFIVGLGAVGASYLATQYLIGKISESRERRKTERIAKESLRRRFNQNQEDCTLTVLGLLPTATDAIVEDIPVEQITRELQQQRVDRRGGVAGASAALEPSPSELSSSASVSVSGEDGKSLASFHTESYVHASRADSRNAVDPVIAEMALPRKSKAMLWNELKTASVTRMLTLIYTLAHLTILTRIQLNLLGRRSYVASVVASVVSSSPDDLETINLENGEDMKTDRLIGEAFETNRNFLAFSWWLLHRGWRDLRVKIEAAVKEVFGPINPREEVTFERLAELILETRKRIEGATQHDRRSQNWLPYLLPPQDQEALVLRESGVLIATSSPPGDPRLPSPHHESTPTSASEPEKSIQPITIPASTPRPPVEFTVLPSLRRLLDETADLIESPRATHVLTCVLDALFSQLTDVAIRSQAYNVHPSLSQQRIQEISDGHGKARLANVLAVMTRQAHVIANGGVENTYSRATEGTVELEGFAAVIFSSHYEVEIRTMQTIGGEMTDLHGQLAQPPLTEKEISRTIHTEMDQGQDQISGGIVSATWGIFEGVWRTITG